MGYNFKELLNIVHNEMRSGKFSAEAGELIEKD